MTAASKVRAHVRHRRLTRRETLQLAGLGSLSTLFLVGCGGEDPPLIEGEFAESDELGAARLQEVLDRRAEAQLTGDEQAYLADLDEGNDELIAQERAVFANLRLFPLDDVQFLVPRRPLYDEGDSDGTARFGPVVKVVRLTTDDGPSGVLGPGEAFEYRIAARDGRIVIVDIKPLMYEELSTGKYGHGRLTSLSAATPWNLSSLHVTNVGKVWLAGDDSVPDLSPYAAVTESELAVVEDVWGDRPTFPGHVMFFSRDTDTFGQWFELATRTPLESFWGVALPRSGVQENGEVYAAKAVSARMVINLSAIERTGETPDSTMRHEFVHAVTVRAVGFGSTPVRPPTWAIEGFARYIQYRDQPHMMQHVRRQARQAYQSALPATEDFYEGSEDRVLGNYALGSTVFDYINQTHGLTAAVDFYDAVIKYDDTASRPFVEYPAFDGVCEHVLGTSAQDFLQQWDSFVRRS